MGEVQNGKKRKSDQENPADNRGETLLQFIVNQYKRVQQGLYFYTIESYMQRTFNCCRKGN